jgi:tetratricopeptide (TPR) repeat protein
MKGAGLLLTIFAILPVAGAITTILHELGHAITGLMFARAKVRVFIGSYGAVDDSFTLTSKWIDISCRRNPLRWNFGACHHSTNDFSLTQHVIMLLAGSIVPFVAGSIALYAAFALRLHTLIIIAAFIFFCTALIYALVSLVPQRRPIPWLGAYTLYNDGSHIAALLRKRAYYSAWREAQDRLHEGKYLEAGAVAETILARHTKDKDVYRLAIASYYAVYDFEKVYRMVKAFEEHLTLEADDLITAGSIKGQLGHYDECLMDFDEALMQDENNYLAWANRGYTLNVMERYEEAIEDFNAAIELKPDFAYSHSNRGLAWLKLGMNDEGLRDLHHALELNAADSFANRNLGIYYFDCGDFPKALELFEKARELGEHTHMVDEYIERARAMLPAADPV